MRAQIHRLLKRLRHESHGITGLETAIILIAFVVVASVFAYTVLSAGIFSSQKSKEAVNSGIEEVRSSFVPKGNVIGYKGSVDIDGNTATSDGVDALVRLDLPLGVAIQGLPIDLTPSHQLNATNGNLEPSGSSNTLVISYLDEVQALTDIAWTVQFIGNNDGDNSLELTEKAIVTVWLVDYKFDATAGLFYTLGSGASDPFIDVQANLLGNYGQFALELSPVQGSTLFIEKVVPQSLNTIMNMH